MTEAVSTLTLPRKFGDVWNSTKPYQIWYGSRYSSKSWSKAAQLMLKAMSATYFRGVFGRDTQKNVRGSQFQLFKDLEKKFSCFRGKFDFHESTMKVVAKNTGNFMIGGSFEQPNSLRSLADPTDFWAEEPITRESQINRQDFIDIAGSLRNTENVPCIFHFTFNPISKQTWIYEDFFENNLYADEVEILKINWYDNQYCPEDRKKFLERLKVIDPERYKVDGEGEWGTAMEGLVYKSWHLVKPEEMPEPQFYGVDFGSQAPSAVVEGAVIDEVGKTKTDYYVREVLYERDLTETSFIQRLVDRGVRKDLPMICDSSGRAMIQALQLAGFNAKPCTKYDGSVKDGIRAVHDHNLKIVQGSKHLLDEIKNFDWDLGWDGKPTDKPNPKAVDHAMDAMRYGPESRRHVPTGSQEIEDY